MSDTENPRRSIAGPVILTLGGLLLIGAIAGLPFWVGPPPEDGLPDIAKFIGHFHPVLLHLPIGMLLLVLVLETGRLFSRKKPSSSTQVAMFFAAASAVVAMLLGFVLYYSGAGDYGKELGERHLYGGLIFACCAVAAFIVKVWVDVAGGSGSWLYWIMLLGTTGIMGFASHDGASMTHGPDYLTKYAPDEVRQLMGMPLKEGKGEKESGGDQVIPVSKPPSEQIVYTDIIVPILEEKCYSCHNPDKLKGKYRMDEYELLVKGGKEGDGIVPGSSEESNMIYRIELPADDDEHMPTKGEDLSPHELVVVKWWIDAGASPDAKLADIEATEEVTLAISRLVPPEELARQKAAAEEAVALEADKREAIKAAVEKLRGEFPAALNFESQSSSGVTFTAVSMRKDFGDADLAKLEPVMAAMVSLDLSDSTVTDQGAMSLAKAAELKSLRLSKTAITDACLDVLASLPSLESLNLYGTQVTNEGVLKLAALTNLKKLYLWETGVDDAGLQALKSKLPDCEIVMGL